MQRTTNPRGSSEPRSGAGSASHATRHRTASNGQPQRSYLELGALPGAVPCARLHVRNVLWEWELEQLSERAELVVAELVTNAVEIMAGRELPVPIRLWLSGDHGRVLIEVWDDDPEPPQLKPLDEDGFPSLDDEHGRGLFLVAMYSARWSWYPAGQGIGKVVWAEIAG